jgi:hypothetical protein
MCFKLKFLWSNSVDAGTAISRWTGVGSIGLVGKKTLILMVFLFAETTMAQEAQDVDSMPVLKFDTPVKNSPEPNTQETISEPVRSPKKTRVQKKASPKKKSKSRSKPTMSQKTGLFLDGIYSYQRQAERKFQTNDESVYELTVFDGTTFFPGFHYQFDMDETFSGKLSFVTRNIDLEGDAQLQEAPNGTGNRLLIEQTFFGIGFDLMWWPEEWKRAYLSAGFEWDFGQTIKVKPLTGANIDTTDVVTNRYFILRFGTGFDFVVSKRFCAGVTSNFGAATNVTPIIVIADVGLRFGYLF